MRFLVHVRSERARPTAPLKKYYPASIFYDRFRHWATRNGEKVISQTAFGNAISGHIIKSRDSKNGRKVYDINSIKLPDLDDRHLQELPPDADVYEEADMTFSTFIP